MNDASSRQPGTTWLHRRNQLAAVCAVLVALMLCLFPFGTTRATAAGASSSARISLDGNLPAVSASGQSVVVSGTITNTGSTTIDNPVVHLSINSEHLLDTRSAGQGWVSGTLDLPVRQVATGETDPVSPGSSTSFAVTIPGKQLKFAYGLAALPLAVTVTDGRTSAASAIRGTTRSTLHQQNSQVQTPLQLSVVIPLTLPADSDLFGPSGAERADAWERAVGPDSQVQRTLDAFDGMPVIFAIDPELLDPPAAADDNVPTAGPTPSSSSSEGSSSSSESDSSDDSGSSDSTSAPDPTSTDQPTSDASTTESTDGTTATDDATPGDTTSTDSGTDTGSGTGSESPSSSETTAPSTSAGRVSTAVGSLTERLESLSDNQSIWWLPSDDPDLQGLRNAGTQGRNLLTRDLTRRLPEAASALSTTRVVWPAGTTKGAVIRTATKQLSRHDEDAMALLPNRAVPETSTPTAVHRAPGTSGVLSYDEDLSRIFSSSTTSPGTQTSRLLTQLLAVYQQSPGTPRSLSLVAPRSGGANPTELAAQVGALETALWVHLRTGAETETALSEASRTSLLPKPRAGRAYPPTAARAVTAQELRELRLARSRLAALQSVMVDGDEVLPQRTAALDIIGSNRWRGARAKLEAIADRDNVAVSAMLGKLAIRSSTINFFADSGDISVTVSNELNRPVHGMLLHLQPRAYQIKVTDAEQSVDVEAGSHATTRFHIKAVGGGSVPVEAMLRAPNGAPLGTPDSPAQLKINVHPTSGWIMWVLGVLAGLILVIGLWRAVRRGPRTVSEPAPAGEPTPDEAIVDAGPAGNQQTDDQNTDGTERHEDTDDE